MDQKKKIDYKTIDLLLDRLRNRIGARYKQVKVNGELCYLLPNGVVFTFSRPQGFNSIIVEYADNINEANGYNYEDGCQFPLDWGEDKIFEAMVREIENEAI
ncbi:MAG: hypothetical protein QM296_00510 [Bacillota bacterium]|nr:hypothetical protein [Bacillota bacterium]